MYKLFFFLIAVYIFSKVFMRYLFPWLLKLFMKRLIKKQFGHTVDFNQKQEDIHIPKAPKNKPQKPLSDGEEYVDYVEIKD